MGRRTEEMDKLCMSISWIAFTNFLPDFFILSPWVETKQRDSVQSAPYWAGHRQINGCSHESTPWQMTNLKCQQTCLCFFVFLDRVTIPSSSDGEGNGSMCNPGLHHVCEWLGTTGQSFQKVVENSDSKFFPTKPVYFSHARISHLGSV